MSIDKNKAVVARYWDEIWNGRRTDLIDDIMTIDHQVHFPPGMAHKIQNVHEWTDTAFKAFPDVKFEVDETIAEGDLVGCRWHYTATNTGSFLGLPATNKEVYDPGINFFKVVDESRISDIWVLQDSLGLLVQLDAIRMRAPEIANNNVAREFFHGVWNEGDFSVLETHLSPDSVDHSTVKGKTETGAESFKQIVSSFRAALPDVKMTIDDEILAGDKIVHRWTISGTHQGELMGIPPSGKTVSFTGTTIARIKDGKIVERWANVDELALLQQIGAIPAPA